MLKILLGKLIVKKGLKKVLLLVGDYAIKASKSEKDDKIWEKVKELLETL